MKILANDGISDSGVEELRKAGFEVITTNVAQEQLENYINTNNVVGLLVRSATTVRKDLIDKCTLAPSICSETIFVSVSPKAPEPES